MKKFLQMLLTAIVSVPLFLSCVDTSEIEGRIDKLDGRVASLEQRVAQMNSDINTLTIMVNVLRNQDYVSSVTEIKDGNKVIGYTINFIKNGTVSVYNGKDGVTPLLEARKHIGDDIYYWWLNNERLRGDNGEWLKVEGVTPQLKIENGFWMLSTDNGETWSNAGKATGEPGKAGEAPVVGVKLFDGVYYWTVNGEFMLDNEGNKIRVQGEKGQDGEPGQPGQDGQPGQPGQNGITPQLKIENNCWMLSTDNGVTWTNMGTAVGSDGDSFFQNVSQDDSYVFLQMKDGAIIKLPKETLLDILFNEWEDIAITGGATKTLNYTVTGATAETVIKAMGQNGWRAKTTAVNNTTGTIAVTAPDPLTDDEVLVWVYDGKTRTIMRSLNFVTGEISVASDAYSLTKDAGTQLVEVTTNIDYVVNIPEDAQSWLSVASTRSAMRTETLTFNLTENKGFIRQTVVTLRNNAGKSLQTIAFEQAGGAISVHVETPGTLSTLLTQEQKQNTVILEVTGTLNDSDYGVIKQMPSLENVNMSNITNTTVLTAMFENNRVIKEVKLPAQLTAIPDKLFNNSSIQVCVIPAQVSSIGIMSFGGCSELLGKLTLPSELKTIGMNAFLNCTKLSGNLTLPEKVTSIGSLAFSGCNNIQKIYSKNPVPPTLGTSVFPNYNYLGVPVEAKESYETAGGADDKWNNFAVIEEVVF